MDDEIRGLNLNPGKCSLGDIKSWRSLCKRRYVFLLFRYRKMGSSRQVVGVCDLWPVLISWAYNQDEKSEKPDQQVGQ